MSKLGQRREIPVLVDVDGVIAAFHKAVLDYVKEKHGRDIDYDSFTMDIREHPQLKDVWWTDVEQFIISNGFAQQLEPLGDAIYEIRKLREKYDVVFVTSSYKTSPTWCFDRYQWLLKYFNIDRSDLIFAHDKRFVCGQTLIDDRWENIIDWSSFHQKPAIMFEQPWNKCFIENPPGRILRPEDSISMKSYLFLSKKHGRPAEFYIAKNWAHVHNFIEEYVKEKR